MVVWEREHTGPGTLAADPVTAESRVLRRHRFRRGRVFGALAVLAAAAVIALALNGSLGPARHAAEPAVTVTEQVTPGGASATFGRIPGADPGGPSPRPGSTASASGTPPGTQPRHTLQPSPGSTGGAATATATTARSSAPPVTATATGTATPASGTPTASTGGPADTPWQCGAVAAATKSGKATGQTLQACIRVNDGKLDLTGTLNDTKSGWHEQIVLVLEDSAQGGNGSYTSPACIASDCTFSTSLVPADGEWTVLPEWVKNGKIQSSGSEPGYVDFSP